MLVPPCFILLATKIINDIREQCYSSESMNCENAAKYFLFEALCVVKETKNVSGLLIGCIERISLFSRGYIQNINICVANKLPASCYIFCDVAPLDLTNTITESYNEQVNRSKK